MEVEISLSDDVRPPPVVVGTLEDAGAAGVGDGAGPGADTTVSSRLTWMCPMDCSSILESKLLPLPLLLLPLPPSVGLCE